MFGIAMGISFGLVSPLDYSVFLPAQERWWSPFMKKEKSGTELDLG